MQKIDPHKSAHYLQRWKDAKLNLSKTNSEILRSYISDMEMGLNTSGSVKGGRSTIKLLSIARQMQRILELIEENLGVKDVTKLTEAQLHQLFFGMIKGDIVRIDGKPYKAVGDYATRFKAFWHWHMKVNRKLKIEVLDITTDLDSSKKKQAEFVYFTEKDLEEMLKIADYDTMNYMLFAFDTGIRSPTEAFNIRVSDFQEDFKMLDIRDNISKTFGRKIRLMMCSEAIKKYVEDNKLNGNDLLFTMTAPALNKRLKAIGKKVLGDTVTKGRKAGKDLSLYDIRHASACYWLPRYKSRNQLLYRFGWSEEKEIHYYTKLLGMEDSISEDDMLTGSTKTEIEKKMESLEEVTKLQSQLISNLMEKISQTGYTEDYNHMNETMKLMSKLQEVQGNEIKEEKKKEIELSVKKRYKNYIPDIPIVVTID